MNAVFDFTHHLSVFWFRDVFFINFFQAGVAEGAVVRDFLLYFFSFSCCCWSKVYFRFENQNLLCTPFERLGKWILSVVRWLFHGHFFAWTHSSLNRINTFEAVVTTQCRYRCLLTARKIYRLATWVQFKSRFARMIHHKWRHVPCSTSEISNLISTSSIFDFYYLTRVVRWNHKVVSIVCRHTCWLQSAKLQC